MLGIPVAGVILIGLATSPRQSNGVLLEPGLETLVAALPTMAAVNWFHHNTRLEETSGCHSQMEFIDAAWRFGAEEIVPARFLGDECPKQHIAELAEKLALFTGMDREYFINSRLSLRTLEDFAVQVVSDEGERVGIYDATERTSLKVSYNQLGDSNVGMILMNQDMACRLNVKTNRIYYTANLTLYYPWNYTTEELGPGWKRTHLECLADSMRKTPGMRVLVANGLYDLLTLAGNTRYAISHSGIPREQLTAREYKSGHGVYTSGQEKLTFLEDVRALIVATSDLKGSKN